MLGGTFELNGVRFGYWAATNRTYHIGDYADYDCTLEYRGTDGALYRADWIIYSVYRKNGAISLAARVLQEGIFKAEKVTNYEV